MRAGGQKRLRDFAQELERGPKESEWTSYVNGTLGRLRRREAGADGGAGHDDHAGVVVGGACAERRRRQEREGFVAAVGR